MNPEQLLALLGQLGVPPEQRMAMLQLIMAQGQQPIDPFMGASGFDVGDANDYVDYGRDVNTLLADPMTAASAGMGAYGGANEIGFQAFDPITGPPQPVAAPDRQLLDRYLQRPVDDIGGWIADQIANQGATAFEITGQLQQILNHGPWDDPELEARRVQLAQMVPSYTDEMTGQTRWDYSGIESLAGKLEEQSVAQPAPGSYQDDAGNWWQQGETEASPMTQWYQKQGLPLPTQEYTLEDFTPEGAQYQQQADQLGAAYGAMVPTRSALDDRVQQAYQAMLLARRQPVGTQAHFPGPDAYKRPTPGPQAMGAAMPQTDLAEPVAPPPLAFQGQGPQTPQGPQRPQGSFSNGMAPPTAAPEQDQPGFASRLADQMRELLAQRDQVDPRQQAMDNYLSLSRSRSQMDQLPLDAWKAQQQAQGKVFMEMDPTTKRYKRGTDKGVGQGRLNYGIAQAQGRTPLQDALRQRAMAAFLMGG